MTRISSEILDRLPPQNLEAEQSVLGSVLLDPAVIDDVLPILSPDDFYADANKRLMQHLTAMHNEGAKVDLLLLTERLKRMGDYEAIGGPAYLAQVTQSAPVACHAVHYAEIVREKARRRAIIHAATEMLRDAWCEGEDVTAITERCEQVLQAIHTGDYKGEPVPLGDALVKAIERIQQIRNGQRKAGLMIGLDHFDTAVGGLFPGELVILAARPSIGKTALATQIAEYNGREGRLAYYATLEMKDVDLSMRILAGASGVGMHRIRSGDINDADCEKLVSASGALFGAKMVLHDRAGLSVSDIRRSCRRLQRVGLALIVVDYLQRVTPVNRKVDRHLQVGQITWDLKALALELNVPVLCLSQLGRKAEERDWEKKIRKPRLSDLKESGDIEQDADMVLLLHRQPRAEPTDLILAKNRQGEQAEFGLKFDATRTRFDRATYTEFDAYSGREF